MNKQDANSGNNNTAMRNEKPDTLRLMNVQEVADFLRISKDSVYKLVKTGDLPAARILNKLRFDRMTIEKYFKRREVNNK